MKLIHQSAGKKLYRDGNRLIKSFDESYSKAGILNEALNQARVEESGLNIPKVLGVEVIDGKWSLIWEYIEGETLEELMNKHPEKTDEYLEFFVDLQIAMSKEKVPLLGHLRDKMHSKISASSFPATVRYDLHVRLDGLPPQKAMPRRLPAEQRGHHARRQTLYHRLVACDAGKRIRRRRAHLSYLYVAKERGSCGKISQTVL